jgi:hypothetical protein
MNNREMRTHLISCVGLSTERIRTASERAIAVTYDMHMALRHEHGGALLSEMTGIN